MAMPPMLRWAFSRLPLSDAERARLEREDFEARGFLPHVDRLLVVVDASPTGSWPRGSRGCWPPRRQADHGNGARAARWPAETRSPIPRGSGKEQVRRAAAGTDAAAVAHEEPPRRRRRDHAHPPGGESTSGRRRGAERLRPADRRDGEDAHGARRISREITRVVGGCRRPARGRDRRRTGRQGSSRSAGSSSRSTASTFAARGRDRLRAGKVDRVARERTLRGDRQLEWRRPGRIRRGVDRGAAKRRCSRTSPSLPTATTPGCARRCASMPPSRRRSCARPSAGLRPRRPRRHAARATRCSSATWPPRCSNAATPRFCRRELSIGVSGVARMERSRRSPDERSEIRERSIGLNACPGFSLRSSGLLAN